MKMLSVLALASASLVLAQAPPDAPQRGRANFAGRPARASRIDHVSEVLNLSAAQQQKAHELFQDEAVTSQGFGQKMATQHAAMRDAIKRGATAEEIDRIAQDGAAVQAQATATHAKTMAKLYSTLTADQRKTFDEHPELMGGGGSGPRGPRPGPDGAAGARFKKSAPVQQQ